MPFRPDTTNWKMGRLIVEEEQKGAQRADYGKQLLSFLSKQLTEDFGKGFGKTNLKQMRLFYKAFSIGHAVSDQLKASALSISADINNTVREKSSLPSLRPELSWTHYRHLLKIKDESVRRWYMDEAANENWSTRALERQINSFHYQRLLSSKDPTPVTEEARQKTAELRPQDILRDPYVLEFLQLAEKSSYTEADLESAIIDQL